MVQKCNRAADVTLAARRRLLADLKKLQEEPIPLAAAQPCSDADITLWNGVIGVELDVTHIGTVTVPLHFLIDFPYNYPQSAPNIGFSFEFSYRGGAQYTMPDGRLKGKKVICLDVLGNFQDHHTEWKNQVGSGWSPAYTVTTLLVQLQSVLCDLGRDMSQRERDVCYQSAVRFCEQNPTSILEIIDEDDIRDRRAEQKTALNMAAICRGDEELSDKVEAFAKKHGILEDGDKLAEFLALLSDVKATSACSDSESTATSSKQKLPEIDANICCFATGKLYTEALLGVGVSRERRNVTTAGELLSQSAYVEGLRQNTNKSSFEFFLPVWINAQHASESEEWRRALRTSYMQIGQQALEVTLEDDCILQVFPRLINQMIVEMMKPDADKSEAIATFEALCNFWRTFRWLVDTKKTVSDRLRKALTSFVTDEAFRHKDNTPDLGMLLVFYTVFRGHEGCPSRQRFVDAYLSENTLRWVMWWQRAGTPAESGPVFDATKVSREIFLFQLMVVDVVLGNVEETLEQMEATNCKLPAKLEQLQRLWKERKTVIKDWQAFFRHAGASQPEFPSSNAWIAECVRRAAAKGPKYGGPKGSGKGDSKGKGKGKGDNKGKGKGGK
eukprot:TRINITY_DN2065_c0_g1_i2.p1 TRINITY_DN2065_c0_g1~~TRINITY_DN2065_c0_g1_i2.p1  ORF type:complete len:614 (-),score=143.84 TRINITY_DN2065_c0_g1_i2:327-2168(-)